MLKLEGSKSGNLRSPLRHSVIRASFVIRASSFVIRDALLFDVELAAGYFGLGVAFLAEALAEHGYETAHDILFPKKNRRIKKFRSTRY